MNCETDSVILTGCSVQAKRPAQRKWMPKIVESAGIDVDGFSLTLEYCRDQGLAIPEDSLAILRIFFTSGMAFSPYDQTPKSQRASWVNSILFPIKASVKVLIILFSIACVQAAVVDLGVLTERTGIMLEHATNRPDFFHYRIELIPPCCPTNSVTIVRTNDLLTVKDFRSMPDGPCLMAVHSVCVDGEESPVVFYRVDVRREAPAPPGARKIAIAVEPATNAPALHLIRMHRSSLTNSPPLPGATNRTYSDHVFEEQVRAAKGMRRSE